MSDLTVQQIAAQMGVDYSGLAPEVQATAENILRYGGNVSLFLEQFKGEAKDAPAAQAKPGNSVFAGTGLERGEDRIMSKDEYKDVKQHYITEYGAVLSDKQIKEAVQVRKAADRVRASVYFTPDQKEDYKAQKKELEKQGKRPVLLTKEDMEMLKNEEYKTAVKKDANGKIVDVDDNELKRIAAERLGTDNTLEIDERRSETAALRGEKLKNGKITHNQARKTKNFYKHLGFDYDKDLTEWKRAGVVAGSTLLGAGAGAALSQTALGAFQTTAKVAEVVIPGATHVIPGAKTPVYTENIDGGGGVIISGYDQAPDKVIKDPDTVIPGQETTTEGHISPWKGAASGALTGLGLGLAAMPLVKSDLEKSKDILNQRTVEAFLADPEAKISGMKYKDCQNTMKAIIAEARQKGMIENGALRDMMVRAEGIRFDETGKPLEGNDALTRKELTQLYMAVKKYEAPKADDQVVDDGVPAVTDDKDCEAEIIDEEVDVQTKIPNQAYKMQRGDVLSNVIAAKYGITDPKDLKAAIKEVRKATGIPENGLLNGKTAIPQIEVDGKTLRDAYFLPESILGDKYKLDMDKAGKKQKYTPRKGNAVQGSNNEATVTRKGKNYTVTGCKNEPLYEGPDAAAANKAKADYDGKRKK